MRLNRRQLRRLIESAIYEQAEGEKKQVVPKEVRAEMKKMNLGGYTALAFDGSGNRGLAVELRGESLDDVPIAFERLKKIYGEDRVSMDGIKKLQGGSSGIKKISGERVDIDKDTFLEFRNEEKTIFIKMD